MDENKNEVPNHLHGEKCPRTSRLAGLQAFLILFIIVLAASGIYMGYAYGERNGFSQARDACFIYVEETKEELWCDNPSGGSLTNFGDFNILIPEVETNDK